jgi:hypothetical protein
MSDSACDLLIERNGIDVGARRTARLYREPGQAPVPWGGTADAEGCPTCSRGLHRRVDHPSDHLVSGQQHGIRVHEAFQ